jgi:hypothetical protein
MTLRSTQPLTEMSTRNLSEGKGWPVCKVDNLTAICDLTVWTKYWSLDVSQPYGPSWPVTGITLLLLTLQALIIQLCNSYLSFRCVK